MKIFAGMLSTAIIILVGTVLLNWKNIDLNANEISHEKQIRVLTDKALKESIDNNTKVLKNIETHLRTIAGKTERVYEGQ